MSEYKKLAYHASVSDGPHVWFDGDNYSWPYTHLNKGSTITKEEEFRQYYDKQIELYGNSEYFDAMYQKNINK